MFKCIAFIYFEVNENRLHQTQKYEIGDYRLDNPYILIDSLSKYVSFLFVVCFKFGFMILVI